LVCEIKDDDPLLIDSLPGEASFEPGALRSGRVLGGETELPIAVIKSKEGEFYFPSLAGWNREGDKIVEIRIDGAEPPRSLPILLDVGDIDGNSVDEVVVGANNPDTLILFKSVSGKLSEASRFSLANEDVVINTIFIANTDNSPDSINELVVGGACLNVDNRMSGFYLEIFGFSPNFHSKWQCMKREIGEAPVQYAAFGKKRSRDKS